FTSSGLQNSDTIDSVTLTSAGTAATAHVIGSPYTITPSAATGTFTLTDYAITYNNALTGFTVNTAALGITADNATRLYGDANPAFSATYTGFQNGETAAALTGALAFATPATSASNVGNYTITPSGQNSANYIIAYVNGTLGVTPVSLIVTASAQSKTYGTSDPALTFGVTGLVNNPILGIADTAATVFSGALTRTSGETVLGGPYAIAQGTLAANSNYTLGSFTGNALAITPAPLGVAAHPQSKLFGASDPSLTFSVAGLVNNPALGIADTAGTVLSGALTRAPGESALGGPYAITQSTLATNSNYSLSFMSSNLVITGAAAEPVLGFNAGQVVFAGVINNDFYYRPGNFWHISLNSNNADPGFDVMRGTNDSGSRLSKRMNSCDSVSGGGFCETWSFPQQRERVDKK
ncbi:MAG: MBG domain-containing protein, partial [Gallionella sp.]|nr:MBG domain-containing protein [Gallionella sp.]